MEEDKLTSKTYWESYYKHNHASKDHIVSVGSYYDAYWNIFFKLDHASKSLIEIGGFPGRYLAYLASNYHLEPTCLDYNSDKDQIETSFEVMNVVNYDIIQEDFTTYKTNKKYDYVLSNGFIEHFEDYDSILDTHVNYLKNKGRMLIMVPNMKGYIGFYKWLVDFKNLKIHNLECMHLSVFKSFAKRNNLKIIELNYFGGFPYNVHQKLNLGQKIIYKIHYKFFKNFGNKWLKSQPSKYFSSGIISIFEKNDN